MNDYRPSLIEIAVAFVLFLAVWLLIAWLVIRCDSPSASASPFYGRASSDATPRRNSVARPVPVPGLPSGTGINQPIRSAFATPAVQARAADVAQPVSVRFLDALERIESGGNTHAIGDGGRARGAYQFWAAAWDDVSAHRIARGQSVVHYVFGSTNRAVARSYAASYLGKLHQTLTTALRREPTPAELYAAWNLGPSGFKRRGFSLSRCPATTQRAALHFRAGISTGDRRRPHTVDAH